MAISPGRLPNELRQLLDSDLDSACYREIADQQVTSLPQKDVRGEAFRPQSKADPATLLSICEFGSPNQSCGRNRVALRRLQLLKTLMDDHEDAAVAIARGFDRPF
ncbi:MAG: hypothetical protein OES26_26755 [Gammaproteobacteria bacterium]|nr:hypothetical protein [Gammaproteobacteria bacterium]